MDEKANYEWGRGQPLAPSVKRIDPVGWIVGSSARGGNRTANPAAAPPRAASSAPGRMDGLRNVPGMLMGWLQ